MFTAKTCIVGNLAGCRKPVSTCATYEVTRTDSLPLFEGLTLGDMSQSPLSPRHRPVHAQA